MHFLVEEEAFAPSTRSWWKKMNTDSAEIEPGRHETRRVGQKSDRRWGNQTSGE
jgi:hypothetical protein